ncbi:Lrp/AsnC family transcriptional regulator [Streptomyces sp. NPDC087440]|uniref:Lrp/AsnC family transcriptional regulator n=1 Tax=Streptomyces sp. NPDC087440 TaxID=3365790 RepID=UPI003807A52F
MQESRPALDGADRALVHALQVDARASWSRLATVLGADEVTLARRWARLNERGAAWINGHPGMALSTQGCLSFVEVVCANGQVVEVAERLQRHPMVVTVEHLTGDRDLLLTLMTPDVASLSQWLTQVAGLTPGITSVRTHLADSVYTEGSRWRTHALSAAQVAQLQRGTPTGERPSVPVLDEVDRRITALLSVDGRASYRDLAHRSGVSADTVRRRTKRLLDSGAVQLRCEISRLLSDRPTTVILWARTPVERLESTARHIAGMGDIRLCAGVTGRDNLLVAGWIRSVNDLQRLESRILERAPHVVINERAVTLRTMKLSGQVLAADGLRQYAVPIDPWLSLDSADDDRAPAPQ